MTLQNENRKLNLVKCNRCGGFHATDKGCNVRSEHIAPVVRSNATTGWISVKDRLPEDAMLYLCFGEIWYNKNIQQQFIRVVEYKNCKFRCDFNPCAYVTHWMPLPEPPEV